MAADRPGGSYSGLTEAEAKEFHAGFMTMFLVFTGIAVVAHYLVWIWRPWIPGTAGWKAAALIDNVTAGVAQITTLLT